MPLSPPTLHPRLRLGADALADLPERIATAAFERRELFEAELVEAPGTVRIPLTTVSLSGGFDAMINVGLAGRPNAHIPLMVDSGNSTLILPRWEDIAGLPDHGARYEVLGEHREPWGCPAKIVRGPILLESMTEPFLLEDFVFYACTGDNDRGERTANFGAGCLSPWTAGGWNTPIGPSTVLTSPLANAGSFRFAVFDYAPADRIFAEDRSLRVEASSWLRLSIAEPAGFTIFPIRPNIAWMSVAAKALTIAGQRTAWPSPDAASPPLAVIDTGGTCAFLSDPGRLVCATAWPHPTANPGWTQGSTECESIQDSIIVEIGDSARSFTYTIDPARLTPSTRGLTLVMCRDNVFMRGERGMNIGGISALMNLILIDYSGARVGFRAK